MCLFLSILQEGTTTETRINVPLHFLAEKPCVQVKCIPEKGVSGHGALPFFSSHSFKLLFCRCGGQILLFMVEEFCARTVSEVKIHTQAQVYHHMHFYASLHE